MVRKNYREGFTAGGRPMIPVDVNTVITVYLLLIK
jgi:hypothetical protein